MSLKYLNLTGLSTLVTDMKNWVTSKIPTKTSEITNDSGFITSSSLPTKTSDLTNDSGYITSASVPAVNNGTLKIQQNGSDIATFSANQSTPATANITVPTKTSDLTNDSGYITNTSDCVHLTGDETVAGVKTFTNIPVQIPAGTGTIAAIWLKFSGVTLGTAPAKTYSFSYRSVDSNNAVVGDFMIQHQSNGYNTATIRAVNKNDSTTYDRRLQLNVRQSDGYTTFQPNTTGVFNLGTPSYVWRCTWTNQINGLNPGVMSMPNIAGCVDIASSITDLTGGNSWYVAPSDGYVCVVANGTVTMMVHPSSDSYAYGAQGSPDVEGNSWVTVPVRAGYRDRIRVNGTLLRALFIPCTGNV